MLQAWIGSWGLAGRAGLALGLGLLAGWITIPALIAWARQSGLGDRDDKSDSDRLNEIHKSKRGTPVIGGIAIVISTTLASLLCADFGHDEPWVLLSVLLGLGALGLADDVAKTFGRKRTQGLTARQKLLGQFVVGTLLASYLVARAWETPALAAQTSLWVPVLGATIPLGALGYVLVSATLLTGSSNAVNLTDGLDGLAGGCAVVALGFYLLVAATVSDPLRAQSWGLHPLAVGETCVVLAALLGAVVAFLWFNWHPAQTFMGDTGSLPLGGVLATAAMLTHQELILAVVGGVFVAEALSVIGQVGSFKLTGKRIFACAPLHHHFEFKGWTERRIVRRFHTAALALALLGAASLGAL